MMKSSSQYALKQLDMLCDGVIAAAQSLCTECSPETITQAGVRCVYSGSSFGALVSGCRWRDSHY
jgi:hypothetical protein